MENKHDTGILLVGHGSRLPYNKEVITTLAEKYKQIMPDYAIEVGFMELVEPNIPTAFEKLKKTGANKIIVNPIFLAHGMHTTVDIPTILNLEPLADMEKIHEHERSPSHSHSHHREAKSEPVDFSGEIIYLEPLGADDKIVEIISDKINAELESIPDSNPNNTGILLAGHGSSLPYNNEVIESIAKKYMEKTEDYPIKAGFMRLSKPSIVESFNKLKEHELEHVIVMPVFLAHGIHTKLDMPTTLGLNPKPIENYPEPNVSKTDIVEFDGEISYLEPIKAEDKIVEIISSRIEKYL